MSALACAAVAAVAGYGSVAAAAPRVISPQRIYSAPNLSVSMSDVSPADEGIVLISLASGVSGAPNSNLSAVARVRNSSGAFGSVQELNRSTDGAAAPFFGRMEFTRGGTTIIRLDDMEGGGRFVVRRARSPFSSPVAFGMGNNPRCASGSATFDSTDRLLLVCPIQRGLLDDWTLGYLTSTNLSGDLGTLTSGFEAGSLDGGSTNHYAAAVGPGGVRAIAWSTKATASRSDFRAMIDTGLGVFQTPVTLHSLTRAPLFPYGRVQSVAVLGDGSLAVGWEQVGGDIPSASHQFRFKVRSPGPTGVFGAEETLGPSIQQADIVADGAAGDALIGWGHEQLGAGDTWRYYVGARPRGGPLGTAVKLPNSDAPVGGGPGNYWIDRGADGTAAVTVCLARSVRTWVRPVGARSRTAFLGPFVLQTAPTGKTPRNCSGGVDRRGNVFATWNLEDDGSSSGAVYAGGVEVGRAPTLGSLRGPTKVVAGTRYAYSTTAADTSGIASIRWDFGDRTAASGAAVAHGWRRPGRYRVRVAATDRAGVRSTRSIVVTVVRG